MIEFLIGVDGGGSGTRVRLARTDGVICPPNVDPQMAEPPRATGTMKVIPPPGSGSDPAVRPK